jgi:hypothetical protein
LPQRFGAEVEVKGTGEGTTAEDGILGATVEEGILGVTAEGESTDDGRGAVVVEVGVVAAEVGDVLEVAVVGVGELA